MPGAGIQYLSRKDIDTDKWDQCIENNANGLIYSKSFFLDKMAGNWSAVVINDYEAVMPLPLRRKFGITYQFRPAFIQQLGMIGNIRLFNAAVLKELTVRIRYGTMLFNFSNDALAKQMKAEPHVNLVLDLSAGYESISAGFSYTTRRSITQSILNNLEYVHSDNTEEAISLYKNLYSDRIPSIREADYAALMALCENLGEKGMCFVRKVMKEDGQVLSSALLLKDKKRIYNLIMTTPAAGRRTLSNYFLIDSLLREFSGQSLLFDFEGSDVKGVKDFYKKFGPTNQPYYHLTYNRLPWPVNLLKR